MFSGTPVGCGEAGSPPPKSRGFVCDSCEYFGGGRIGTFDLPPHNVDEFLEGRVTGTPPYSDSGYLGGEGTGRPPNAGEYFEGREQVLFLTTSVITTATPKAASHF